MRLVYRVCVPVTRPDCAKILAQNLKVVQKAFLGLAKPKRLMQTKKLKLLVESSTREVDLAELTPSHIEAALSGDLDELGVHLVMLERDIAVAGTKVKVHCHCLTVDANGRIKVARLAEYMRDCLIDYTVPKSRIEEARRRDAEKRSSSAMVQLHYVAKNAFTDLDLSGEGGELLLFLLAERFLRMPQILCKMDLKTDSRMHYHGADGVYAKVDDDGVLSLFWGESKLYNDPSAAIRMCLNSLSPFLLQPDSEEAERERDLVLLSDKADLNDPKITAALQKYFDKKSPASNRVRYCAVALVGFDVDFYPGPNVEAVADDIAAAARTAISGWLSQIANRIATETLHQFNIEFFCVPLPSAKGFRDEFKKALGLQ